MGCDPTLLGAKPVLGMSSSLYHWSVRRPHAAGYLDNLAMPLSPPCNRKIKTACHGIGELLIVSSIRQKMGSLVLAGHFRKSSHY